MNEKKPYFKLRLNSRTAVVTPEEMKLELDALVENGDDSTYELTLVNLTQEEYNNLPDFEGF